MASDAQVRLVVDAIYRGAAESETWPEALTLLADALDSTTSGFAYGRRHGGGGISLFVRSDPAWERTYNEYYAYRNPFQRSAHLIREGFVAAGQAMLPPDQLVKTEFCADFLAKQNVFHSLGAFPVIRGDTASSLVFYRPKRRPQFGREEVTLLRLLSPHFALAMEIHERLTSQLHPFAAATALTEELPFGVILFDSGGRVRLLNAMAERILALNDGLSLSRGEITAPDARVRTELRRCISSAAIPPADPMTQRGGTIVVQRPSMLRPLRLLVFPLDVIHGGGPACAVGFLSDTEGRPQLCLEDIRRALGVTSREAMLVAGLASGDDLRGISRGAGISFDTARSHLKNVFRKTGIRSQSDLVSLILKIPGLNRSEE